MCGVTWVNCVYLVFDHWLEKSKCDIEKALISEKVEFLDFFDDKMDFLIADDKFNENKVFKNTPIFPVEKIKDRKIFRTMIKQLNLSPKKKELVHW